MRTPRKDARGRRRRRILAVTVDVRVFSFHFFGFFSATREREPLLLRPLLGSHMFPALLCRANDFRSGEPDAELGPLRPRPIADFLEVIM